MFIQQVFNFCQLSVFLYSLASSSRSKNIFFTLPFLIFWVKSNMEKNNNDTFRLYFRRSFFEFFYSYQIVIVRFGNASQGHMSCSSNFWKISCLYNVNTYLLFLSHEFFKWQSVFLAEYNNLAISPSHKYKCTELISLFEIEADIKRWFLKAFNLSIVILFNPFVSAKAL